MLTAPPAACCVYYLTRRRIGYTYSHSKNYKTAAAALAAAMAYSRRAPATRAAVLVTPRGVEYVNTAPMLPPSPPPPRVHLARARASA